MPRHSKQSFHLAKAVIPRQASLGLCLLRLRVHAHPLYFGSRGGDAVGKASRRRGGVRPVAIVVLKIENRNPTVCREELENDSLPGHSKLPLRWVSVGNCAFFKSDHFHPTRWELIGGFPSQNTTSS